MMYLLIAITIGAVLSASVAFFMTIYMEEWLERRQIWRLEFGPIEFSNRPESAEDKESCKNYLRSVLRDERLGRDMRVRFVSGLARENFKLLAEVLDDMMIMKEENEDILDFLNTPLIEMGIKPVIYTSLRKFFAYLNDRRLSCEELDAFRQLSREPLMNNRFNSIKRAMSFAFGMIATVTVSPLMMAIYILRWWESPGPIVRKEKRLGLNGHVFDKYIFSTFPLNTNGIPKGDPRKYAEGYPIQVKEDYEKAGRITKALIDWNLWKLPELFNVLKGDMDLFGPRPLCLHELPYFSTEELYTELAMQLSVRPGLIGPAQMQAYREIEFTWERSRELDLIYLNQDTTAKDLPIFMDFFDLFISKFTDRESWLLKRLASA